MDKRTLFDLWAPAASPWSPWAKPAPFVHLPPEIHPMTAFQPPDTRCVPPASDRCAVVVDLAGFESVELGLALVARGYRPVPLFNACPAPIVPGELVRTAVEVGPILNALVAAAAELTAANLPQAAPPAFLIDANRTGAGTLMAPGIFDNRSVVFGSDFPSANFLRQHDINRALLVRAEAIPIGNDLRHALRHWNAGGISLEVITPTGAPLDVKWPGNGFLGEFGLRLFALFRLRRNVHGGFGAFVPEASGG